jgi:Pretoxin HINT domain
MVAIDVRGGGTLRATDHHLFWSATANGYTEADALRVGDRLREPDGRLATISGLHTYTADLTAYNLTVNRTHTYYVVAGQLPGLVHNTCLPQLDSTGKVHGDLPDHVPPDWTVAQLEELEADLKVSIATRKAEQLRLGEDGPHRARIAAEERLLRQIEKVLSGS